MFHLLKWILFNNRYSNEVVIGPFDNKAEAEQFMNERAVESGWEIKTMIMPEDY